MSKEVQQQVQANADAAIAAHAAQRVRDTRRVGCLWLFVALPLVGLLLSRLLA